MATIAGIKRTHNLQILITTDRTWCLIHDEMAGMTFIAPFCNRYLIF